MTQTTQSGSAVPPTTFIRRDGLDRPAGSSHGDQLAAGTAMGPVTLLVGNLDAELAFYRDAIGLQVIEQADARIPGVGRPDVVVLGRAGVPSMVLRYAPDLPRPRRGQAGLFHTAIVFADRASLAVALASVATRAAQLYSGSADHLVSQAFYLTDPEGNGVELYWDRAREDWSWDAQGHVRMDTLALDPNAFLREHVTAEALQGPVGNAGIGHVHLQVGDLAAARSFYVDTLGFEVTGTWQGALFVSAGGYHHHIAVNTWNSAGAGARAASLGLGEVTVLVPGADDLGALRDRVVHHDLAVRDDGATLVFADPWRNVVRVRTAG